VQAVSSVFWFRNTDSQCVTDFYLQLYAVDKGVNSDIAFYAVSQGRIYVLTVISFYSIHPVGHPECWKRLGTDTTKLLCGHPWSLQHAHSLSVRLCDTHVQHLWSQELCWNRCFRSAVWLLLGCLCVKLCPKLNFSFVLDLSCRCFIDSIASRSTQHTHGRTGVSDFFISSFQ